MHPRLALIAFIPLLAACAAMQRSDDAAAAKTHMLDMSRQDVLACMGIPKKKAHAGNTEVWAYPSTDGSGDSQSETQKIGSLSLHNNTRDRSDCTVDIVMTDGIVTRVNYIGPSDSLFAPNEQCGYAVANCVNANRF
ncbi:MAG: hypothetical protein KGI37_08535 [Alphaproteobacteria bacterium]|nr:hypothetical protein [Alphaproteobacteria bacterium]